MGSTGSRIDGIDQCFFFPREPQKSAREHFGKSAREPFEFAREHF